MGGKVSYSNLLSEKRDPRQMAIDCIKQAKKQIAAYGVPLSVPVTMVMPLDIYEIVKDNPEFKKEFGG